MNEHEILVRIAARLTGIQIDDLTKAESQICEILEETGYLKEVEQPFQEKSKDHCYAATKD